MDFKSVIVWIRCFIGDWCLISLLNSLVVWILEMACPSVLESTAWLVYQEVFFIDHGRYFNPYLMFVLTVVVSACLTMVSARKKAD